MVASDRQSGGGHHRPEAAGLTACQENETMAKHKNSGKNSVQSSDKVEGLGLAKPATSDQIKAAMPVTATEMANNANRMGALSVDDALAKKLSGCQMTRAQFFNQAKPVDLVIDGQPNMAFVKEFSSGNFGWYANGKIMLKQTEAVTKADFHKARYITIQIGDERVTAYAQNFSTGSIGWNVSMKGMTKVGDHVVRYQVSLNLTVIHSKDSASDTQYQGYLPCQLGCSLTIIGSKDVR